MATVSQFGAYRFNEAVRFDEAVTAPTSAANYLEGRFGLRVVVYDPHLAIIKAIYDSDQDNCPIAAVEFEHLETGCGQFKIKVNLPAENLVLERGDRVDIHLMHSTRPWYSGQVTEVPSADTDRSQIEFRGYGYVDLLDKIVINESYTDTPIEVIVDDLITSYLGDRPIIFFPDRLMPVGYVVSSVYFDRVSLKEALSSLTDLANNWVYGVDEERVIFFNPIPGRPKSKYSNKASWWVGQDLDSFKLTENTDDIANVLHVKIGEINAADDSNFAPVIPQNLDSIAFFGERHAVLTAPELSSWDDAEVWADYQLDTLGWPAITGKISGIDVPSRMATRDDLLRADGHMRVSLTRGGLVTPYYEPLNGYYRYQGLGSTQVHGLNRVKRDFTARLGGTLGRVRIMGRRVGSPGGLALALKSGSTTLTTVTVADGDSPGWTDWLTFDMNQSIQAEVDYTMELSAASGDASNYYEVLYSTYDATFSAAYYTSTDGGSSWTEDTGKGLIFRAWLVHDDEFILAIKKVKYVANQNDGISATIDLGEIDQPLENVVLKLLRDIKNEELLQQSNVADLSSP